MILFPNAFIPPGLSVTSVVEARAQSFIHQAAASVATQTQEKFSGIFPIEFRPELYYVIYLFFILPLLCGCLLFFVLFFFFSNFSWACYLLIFISISLPILYTFYFTCLSKCLCSQIKMYYLLFFVMCTLPTFPLLTTNQ